MRRWHVTCASGSKVELVAGAFDPTRPLADKRIVVSRSRDQASSLSTRLRELGAEPVEVPMINFEPPSDDGIAARSAMARLGDFEWIVLTSPNGARAFVELLPAASALVPRIACVGPGTARVVSDAGIEVALIPDRSVAEGLVACFPRTETGGAVLILQAEVSRDAVQRGLSDLGWAVERVAAYRTVDAALTPGDRAGAATGDVVTFMSSSAVERFVRLVGTDSLPPVVACIGPITADTARGVGLAVDIEADEHNLDGLLDALVVWATPGEVG